MLCADEFDVAAVVVGNYITSSKKRKYVLTEELGRGGYGSVFKCHEDPFDGKHYAAKVEKKYEHRGQAKLGMEQKIMKLIKDKPLKYKGHFLDILDRGKKTQFYFIVMTLVGESLADLKRSRNPPVYSCATTYAISLQTMEAIEQLHAVGFVHRDIKPGNYAVGLGDACRNIYILDFGIARQILNKQKELKGPRAKVPFKGTVRYAPVACHKNQEPGKKDDCESWLYLLADISNPDGLPWKGEKDRPKVFALKEKVRTPEGGERTFKGLNTQLMGEMLKYLDKLVYADEVDYSYLYQTIRKAAELGKHDLNAPFDWELESPDDETTTPTTNTTTDGGSKQKKKKTEIKPKETLSVYRSTVQPLPK